MNQQNKFWIIASSIALAAGALWWMSADEPENIIVYDENKHSIDQLILFMDDMLHNIIIVYTDALIKLKTNKSASIEKL